jgi:hypothetical protein
LADWLTDGVATPLQHARAPVDQSALALLTRVYGRGRSRQTFAPDTGETGNDQEGHQWRLGRSVENLSDPDLDPVVAVDDEVPVVDDNPAPPSGLLVVLDSIHIQPSAGMGNYYAHSLGNVAQIDASYRPGLAAPNS